MGIRLWLWLIVAQSIWAGTYLAMKVASVDLPIGAIVILRYGLALAGFLPLLAIRGLPRFERRDWALIGGFGAVNFTVSPTLQLWALTYTQSLDVAILVALEPVFTVLFARFVLNEGLSRRTIAAGALGAAGAVVLAGVGLETAGDTGDRLKGNLLFLASMLCEVSVTIAGGRLARRYDALATMGLMKGAGFFAALAVYWQVWGEVQLRTVSGQAWLALLYLGLLASLFSYTVWYHVIRDAPVSSVALTLFLQPLIGVALGFFLGGERVGADTLLGGGLILCAFALQAVSPRSVARVARQ